MSQKKICISCFCEIEGEVCPKCGFIEPAERKSSFLPARMLLGGRYIVGEVLGTDSMAVEYKAWDTETESVVELQEYFPRTVALRAKDSAEIRTDSDKNSEIFAENVATITAGAQKLLGFHGSPNVVNVFDCFEGNNTVYVVKEYIEGMFLSDFVDSCGGSLDEETAFSIMLPVLEGLEELHACGVIHGGITADSVVITADNEIKITDFSFLKKGRPYTTEDITLGLFKEYSPPERYRSKGVYGEYSDIYSAGAVFYKMLSGVKPLDALNRLNGDDIKDIAELVPDIAGHTAKAVMKALNISPDLRFKSASAFKNSLLQIETVEEAEEETKKPKKAAYIIMAAAAALAAVSGTVIYFLLN